MNNSIEVPHEWTSTGFKYGAAEVTRIASDEKRGWVVLEVQSTSGRDCIQVYMSKTGRSVRVHWNGREVPKP